jgi:hypothetical protein
MRVPQIPGVKKAPWYDSELLIESVANVPPAVALFLTAAQVFSDPKKPRWIGAVAVVVGVWLLAAGVLKALRGHQKDKKRAQLESPADLTGCAQVLLAVLKSHCGFTEGDPRKVRITIHRVVTPEGTGVAPQWLEQVIPYVGYDGGEPGRRFPIGSGIIGRVARDHSAYSASWDGTNSHAFIEESVKEWGFTRQQAEDNVTWRRSWFGVPISGRGEKDTIGVVFLDSSEPNLFTPEVQGVIVSACFGVAAYITERYG